MIVPRSSHAAVSKACVAGKEWKPGDFPLALLSLTAFYGLALTSWLAASTVVPWDSKNQFYPMFRFLGEALRNGELPFWNPYHFGGHPAIADPQSLIFTPTMMLFAFVAPKASMQLFDAVVLAHLLAGGICTLGLLRRWHWHPLGAALAAIVAVPVLPLPNRGALGFGNGHRPRYGKTDLSIPVAGSGLREPEI